MTPKGLAIFKSFSPGLLARVVMTFDRLTLVIIAISWSVTIVVMLFTVYTFRLSTEAQKAAEQALATEPTLPTIKHEGVGGKELKTMIDSLQKHYPDIGVSWHENILSIGAPNGGLYHQWLTAIGQVDTMYPQFHWHTVGLCIGKTCGEKFIMNIDLMGENTSFEMPQLPEK